MKRSERSFSRPKGVLFSLSLSGLRAQCVVGSKNLATGLSVRQPGARRTWKTIEW